MNKMWKEILAAAMVGILLPRAIIHTAAWLFPQGENQNQTEVTEPSYSETVPNFETEVPAYIPVLTGNTALRVMGLEDSLCSPMSPSLFFDVLSQAFIKCSRKAFVYGYMLLLLRCFSRVQLCATP